MDPPAVEGRLRGFRGRSAVGGALSRRPEDPLQDKPFHILALLVERPGELVTRDELRQRLWPADTFVDFEHGQNTAVK
jgi:DNA-binding response OmpR family regulator